MLTQNHDPALYHVGEPTRLLHVHEEDVARAFELDGAGGPRVLDPVLFKRAIDTRVLKIATDRLRRRGPKTPGLDGLRLEDLATDETWSLCRALSHGIKTGSYKPGNSWRVKIPKPGKPGEFRELTIQNVTDRIVAKAILLVLEPIVEHLLSPLSFAFRPRRSRANALATASVIASAQARWAWAKADVEKAFDRIPFNRLMTSLATQFPADVITLLRTVASTGKTRGIRQGSPLSPLLFNLYLELTVGRTWSRRHPHIPLIRYADDLLLLCHDRAEADLCYSELSELAQSAGIPFKKAASDVAVDLDAGEDMTWLGYGLSKADETLRVTIAEPSWSKLELSFAVANTKPDSPLLAAAAVRGWLGQLGPCFPFEPTVKTLRRVRVLAAQHAFEELPSGRKLSLQWQRAHEQFVEQVEKAAASLPQNLDVNDTVSLHGS